MLYLYLLVYVLGNKHQRKESQHRQPPVHPPVCSVFSELYVCVGLTNT